MYFFPINIFFLEKDDLYSYCHCPETNPITLLKNGLVKVIFYAIMNYTVAASEQV